MRAVVVAPTVPRALCAALALAASACTLDFDRYLPSDGAAGSDATAPEPPGTCASPRSIPAAGGSVTLYLQAGYGPHTFPCGSGTRPAQYFIWTPATAGRADIQAVGLRVNDQPGTAVDVMLDLRSDECPDGGEVACNDDSTPPGDNGSRLQPTVSAGRSYYIVVGAYSSTPQHNPIVLTVTPPP